MRLRVCNRKRERNALGSRDKEMLHLRHTIFVYLKFHLNAFFFIPLPLFHLLPFPIHSFFDHGCHNKVYNRIQCTVVAGVAGAAVSHSFSFIEFKLIL